ncbi:PAS domain S-box protein [Candidatus Nanosalina sp. VS9-1]|uniref:PAS domain S-box protein n=1 Tax=Candidatus Nanosalina sp. VS9-1 TaxID=3388566 RepID=UPI0039E1BDAB
MAFTDEIYALVVDDDQASAETASMIIDEKSDYVTAEYVTSGEAALEVLESENIHTVVSDYSMPGMDGMELLEEVNENYDLPFILYTGEGSEELAVQALKSGAEDYVTKGGAETFEVLANRVENAAVSKKAEDEVNVFKEGAENAGHAIQVTDPEGRIVYVNPAFEDITGYDESEVIGENPSILSSGEHEDEFYEQMWTTIEAGEVWHGEILNEDSEGEHFWVDQTISPITDNSGDLQYLIAINTDITDKKENKHRREVLNTMLRHDIANNQQVIAGNLTMLQETELDDRQQEYVNKIQRNVNQNTDIMHGIRGLLNDKDGAEKEIGLRDVVNEALEQNKTQADRNNVRIRSDVGDSYNVVAGPLLGQALSNLVENAVVHPENVENVRIGAEASEENIEIFVSDDGDGVPDGFSFEKGAKGDDSDGTGIGTWLVKEIAEEYGNGIEVEESEEGGARFSMRLQQAE